MADSKDVAQTPQQLADYVQAQLAAGGSIADGVTVKGGVCVEASVETRDGNVEVTLWASTRWVTLRVGAACHGEVQWRLTGA